MNYSNTPLTSPLSKPLTIEVYNDTYFSKKDPTIIDNTTDVGELFWLIILLVNIC